MQRRGVGCTLSGMNRPIFCFILGEENLICHKVSDTDRKCGCKSPIRIGLLASSFLLWNSNDQITRKNQLTLEEQ